MSRTLYVIDGFALIFRAFYAFFNRPLINSRGQNTSAVFGFFRMVFKLIRDYAPADLVIALDGKGKTFRHELYHEYKANRYKAPEELLAQIPWILELIEAFGIPALSRDGFEADDIMAALAGRCRERGYGCRIFSGDKDILQLMGDGVDILAAAKAGEGIETWTEAMVREKFGVAPGQMADYLALVGDSSDNVPGVKGIGAKGAVKLLEEFGSIEGVYENLDKVKPDGTRRKLEEGRADAELSLNLVRLRPLEGLEIPEAEWAFAGLNGARAAERLRELELATLLEDPLVQGGAAGAAAPVLREAGDLTAVPVLTIPELEALLARVAAAPVVALDTETTSLDTIAADILGVSLALEPGTGYYIPLGHQDNPLDAAAALPLLKKTLEAYRGLVAGQNLKFDLQVLAKAGIAVGAPLFDTMVAAYLLEPGQRFGIEELARRWLGREMIRYSDVVEDKEGTLFDVALDTVTTYAAEDAEVAFCLYGILHKELEEKGLDKLAAEMEMPLVGVLAAMERRGMLLDPARFTALSDRIGEELVHVERDICAAAGEEFNLNSPKQLGVILFEKLKLPPVKKTKTGYSTDEEVLQELAIAHPIAASLLAYRKLAKLRNTYVDVLPTLVHPLTGRVHTSFNQTVTATGRLSSSRPNLQNIPIREALGREVRRGFVAPAGCRLLSADYSQIELRVLAALSGDAELVRSYGAGADIHARTAAAIFGMEEKAVGREERAAAKTVNFGVIYGQSAFGLARELGIPRGEAQRFIDAYFALYGGVRAFFDTVINTAAEQGFVRTRFGRIRPLPELASRNRNNRLLGERLAVNTVIQGTAADLIKLAMLGVETRLKREGLAAVLLLQVHDELLLEVPERELAAVTKLVDEEMRRPWPFALPLEVGIGSGADWDEAH